MPFEQSSIFHCFANRNQLDDDQVDDTLNFMKNLLIFEVGHIANAPREITAYD